jgi:hypothetical protein
MMGKTFEEMNKKELVASAVLYGVDKEVEELNVSRAEEAGRTPNKLPANDLYIEVLNRVLNSRKVENAKSIGSKVSSSGKDIIDIKAGYKQTKVRVEITDHDNNTSTEEELDDKVIAIRWGNKGGRYTDFVPSGGRPTHVRQGAIDILKGSVSPVNKAKEVGTKKRFAVADIEPMTQAELDIQAEQKASKK